MQNDHSMTSSSWPSKIGARGCIGTSRPLVNKPLSRLKSGWSTSAGQSSKAFETGLSTLWMTFSACKIPRRRGEMAASDILIHSVKTRGLSLHLGPRQPYEKPVPPRYRSLHSNHDTGAFGAHQAGAYSMRIFGVPSHRTSLAQPSTSGASPYRDNSSHPDSIAPSPWMKLRPIASRKVASSLAAERYRGGPRPAQAFQN